MGKAWKTARTRCALCAPQQTVFRGPRRPGADSPVTGPEIKVAMRGKRAVASGVRATVRRAQGFGAERLHDMQMQAGLERLDERFRQLR